MKKHGSGFTLMEVLIALLILGIISIMMVTGLRSAIRSQNRLSKKAAQIANIQKGMIIIERDILQIINRPILAVNGIRLPAVMVRYQAGSLNLEFTRAGFINPFGIQNRTTMQRVSYNLDGKNLIRTTWAELDRVPETPSDSQVILGDVNSFSVQFVDEKRQITTPTETSLQLDMPLPIAIEIDLEIEGMGIVSRLMPLAS